jgi:hypothetical protein
MAARLRLNLRRCTCTTRVWPSYSTKRELSIPSVNLYSSHLSQWRTNATVGGNSVAPVSTDPDFGAHLPSADTGYGYNGCLSKVRSLTMHPLGFLLTDLFHRKPQEGGLTLPAQLEKFRSHQSDETGENAVETKFASLLQWWLKKSRVRGGKKKSREWRNGRDLTTLLAKSMAPFWRDDARVRVTHENRLPWGRTFSKADIMVVGAGSGEKHEDLAVLMIEMGLSNSQWWKKLHHGIMYIESLLSLDMLQKPMLLTVFTVDAPPHKDSSEKIREFTGAQVGVFLVVPKGYKKDFRISLLWREHTEKQEDVPNWFVRIQRAAEFVMKWNKDKTSGEDLDYEYLGPHCCRIGDEVRVSFRLVRHLCSLRPIILISLLRCFGVMTTDYATQNAAQMCILGDTTFFRVHRNSLKSRIEGVPFWILVSKRSSTVMTTATTRTGCGSFAVS